MIEVFPNYYKKFKCIADECQHSCCIGWEIDIDEDTMDLYDSLDGEFAEKIKSNIKGEPPHFVLKEGDRCPFLNENRLCDIICKLGDGAVSDICYLHPRFSNFYEDFTETGLGICCEEAARIILTEKEKFSIPIPEWAENDAFFKERREVFNILQDRTKSIPERFEILAKKYKLDFNFSNDKLYELFMSLERLDEKWEMYLAKLKENKDLHIFEREDLQIFFEQLSVYFIFRHFERGVGFALLSCWTIGAICASVQNFREILDIARMYSSEIEYSEPNTEKLINYIN